MSAPQTGSDGVRAGDVRGNARRANETGATGAADAGGMTGMAHSPAPRSDHLFIRNLVPRGARVLDIGCGDGALLDLLTRDNDVDGRGLELSQSGVNICVARGLSVIQGDANSDLADYPDNAFDYAILSQTLQAMQAPRTVLENLLRLSHRAIVSIPNFGHWRNRLQLAFQGRMPVTDYLPCSWYDTPNIHFCTIRDFLDLCRQTNARIEQAAALDARGRLVFESVRSQGRPHSPWWLWNLIAEQAVFLLRPHSPAPAAAEPPGPQQTHSAHPRSQASPATH